MTVRYDSPVADDARVLLHNRYQAEQETRKGWDEAGRTLEEYAAIFLNNPIPSAEISAWEGEKLLAVALTDLTPNTLSGVYHYYEPDARERGLGTFIMLHCLELALRLKKPYAYFGYYVRDCPSLVLQGQLPPLRDLGRTNPFVA